MAAEIKFLRSLEKMPRRSPFGLSTVQCTQTRSLVPIKDCVDFMALHLKSTLATYRIDNLAHPVPLCACLTACTFPKKEK